MGAEGNERKGNDEEIELLKVDESGKSSGEYLLAIFVRLNTSSAIQ